MFLSLILLVCLVLLYKLRIIMDDETLCAAFGIGVIRKRVPVAKIAACERFESSGSTAGEFT